MIPAAPADAPLAPGKRATTLPGAVPKDAHPVAGKGVDAVPADFARLVGETRAGLPAKPTTPAAVKPSPKLAEMVGDTPGIEETVAEAGEPLPHIAIAGARTDIAISTAPSMDITKPAAMPATSVASGARMAARPDLTNSTETDAEDTARPELKARSQPLTTPVSVASSPTGVAATLLLEGAVPGEKADVKVIKGEARNAMPATPAQNALPAADIMPPMRPKTTPTLPAMVQPVMQALQISDAAPPVEGLWGTGTAPINTGPHSNAQPGLIIPATGPTGQPPAASGLGQQISQQLTGQIRENQNGSIELRLDPPELGMLRVQFSGADTNLTALVTTDNPDTEQLLRRHSEDLANALKEAGYETVSMEFSAFNQFSQTEDEQGDSLDPNAALGDGPAGSDTPAGPLVTVRLAPGGLDIRL